MVWVYNNPIVVFISFYNNHNPDAFSQKIKKLNMNILINWVISALAVFTASYIFPGIQVENFQAALIAALVIGIFNAILKPILVFLTLPITLITLGLFTFVIQAFLIMLAARLVPGFSVDGFFWALVLSLVLTIINYFLKDLKPSN